MSTLVITPNIPINKVTTALAGEMPETIYNAFLALGISIVKIPKSAFLQAPVASHADMLCHHLGGNEILLSKSSKDLQEDLFNLGFNAKIISKELSEQYPSDIALNCARVGKKLICNSNYASPEILDYCNKNNIEIIDVPQGYAKCSVCIVNENAIITEDTSIKIKCEQKGIDVLLVKKGHVTLQGFDYGFIGGCSALISANKLAFFGNIELHPDYKNIKSFLNNYNIVPISISNIKLTDIGGIIPLIERV